MSDLAENVKKNKEKEERLKRQRAENSRKVIKENGKGRRR